MMTKTVMPPINWYENLKAKTQKNFNTLTHFDNLFNMMLARFEIDLGDDTNIPPEVLLGMLMTNGNVGIREVDGKLWAFHGCRCGEIVGYRPKDYCGQLSQVEGRQGRVYDETYEPNGDWVVIKYNATETPELCLYQFANILAEIDVSEKMNVLFSRFLRVPKVHTEKERIAIKECIKNIFEGRFDAVVSDNTLNDVQQFLDATDGEPYLDLVDVDKIDKLQYLNQYRDNIMKRFGQILGQKMQVTSKMAQMSPDEVHANDSFSLILANASLEWIKKGFDDVNKRFGRNWTIDWSPCFLDEVEEMENDNMQDSDEIGVDENEGENSEAGQPSGGSEGAGST